ncbi:MAG: valine--tRNA ligase [bacterium]|nr:valine--tRNA ligase [bacterium]
MPEEKEKNDWGSYDPKQHEDAMYKLWEKGGFFNPDNLPSGHKKPFTIMLPPPNITGSLHMGHALNAAIQDILIRLRRMQGYRALWVPGTDHASIATQNVLEKELKKEGKTRHDVGREKFLELFWAWKEKYGSTILGQLKKLGASCDWSRLRFTMDEGYAKAVEHAFRHYHEKGLIYKGKRVISWCVRCQTSLSDLELEYKEEMGTLWYIRYPITEHERALAGREFLVVATTRPETMLGDQAVAVHPEDRRYKELIGRRVVLPIQNREISVIGDDAVDKDFGTGAVKVTPAHDLTDYEIAQRHNLELRQVIGTDGKMTALAGTEYAGSKTAEARDRIVAALKEQNLLEKEEPYPHSVAICYRCSTVVEPMPSEQWFLKMKELAKLAHTAVKEKRVKFHPSRWEEVFTKRLENERDWCISRQIWLGHRIPLEGETDTFDTWFSSALWPFATLGWPEKTKDLETYYPTQTLSTARDIINLWVSRMVFSGMEFMGRCPFDDVIIHATVLAKDGKRMSKSLGTGVDPMKLIEQYGADATRFGLIWMSLGGQDMKFGEEPIVAGKKFLNKIWNAARFVSTKTNDNIERGFPEKPRLVENASIIESLHQTSDVVTRYLEVYDFGQALHATHEFFWHRFCDQYIEWTKKSLGGDAGDKKDDEETKQVLGAVFVSSLKLLHPFIPFATEALWQHIRKTEWEEQLMVASWPSSIHT